MPSRKTFQDGIKKNLNISEGDLSEAGIPVYINLGMGIRIRGAEGVTGGKSGLYSGLGPAGPGDQYIQFSEAAV